jgi:energy-coupling factor transporter transmembrane protein EcfT
MFYFLFLLVAIIISVILIKKYPNKKLLIIGSVVGGMFLLLVLFVTITVAIVNVNKSSSSSSGNWDEGFNTAWVGTYKSRPNADYDVTFDLDFIGNFSFVYGSNSRISTTYSGKYYKDFRSGNTRSSLGYRVTNLRITSFDENSINITINWIISGKNETDYFTLYRQ